MPRHVHKWVPGPAETPAAQALGRIQRRCAVEGCDATEPHWPGRRAPAPEVEEQLQRIYETVSTAVQQTLAGSDERVLAFLAERADGSDLIRDHARLFLEGRARERVKPKRKATRRRGSG